MNVLKLQQDFLKRLLNEDYWNTTTEWEGKIGLTTQYAVYFIPKGQFFLDLMRMCSKKTPTKATALLKGFTKGSPAFRPGVKREITVGRKKKILERFETKTGYAWLATDYIRYFDPAAEYHVLDNKHTVYVTEHDTIVGAVMPFYLKGEDKQEESKEIS